LPVSSDAVGERRYIKRIPIDPERLLITPSVGWQSVSPNTKRTRRTVLSIIGGGTLAGVATASGRNRNHGRLAASQSTDVEQVVGDSYNVPGLTTDVSGSGETIAFGFDNGDLLINDADRQSEILGFNTGSGLTDIQIKEDNDMAALAWLDVSLYGPLDLTTQDGPLIEHTGLWDIAMAAESATLVSVSQPIEGQGSVMLATEDGQQWEDDFDDASALSVDITSAGETIAVGAAQYWVDTIEQAGTPGVLLYDSEGEQQWSYETDIGVLSTHIDTSTERVIAGTDYDQLLALDLEGELIWDKQQDGGWVQLSGDGSTVVSSTADGVVRAFDTETGDEQWSVEIGVWANEFVSVSEAGDRVLAAARPGEEVYVVSPDGIVWEETYATGPAVGAISGAGDTWSVSIQNTDEQTGRVEIYEEST